MYPGHRDRQSWGERPGVEETQVLCWGPLRGKETLGTPRSKTRLQVSLIKVIFWTAGEVAGGGEPTAHDATGAL